MKKALMILNPKAGKSRAKTSLYVWVETLSRAGYAVDVVMTQKAGHATEATVSMASSHDMIVVAGGDGTLNEVVTGLQRSGIDVPVGYIPTGSTNDFASTLSLSKDPSVAVRDIVKGVVRTIDIGSFNERYFTYIASFGAFTRTSYATTQESKNAFGHLAYIMQSIRDLPSIRAEHFKIVTPEKTYEDDYIFGAVANTTSVAGVVTLDDKIVMMNDGKFELLLIKKPENIGEISICINALLTQDYSTDLIEFAPVDHAEFFSDKPVVWSIDGERADTDGHAVVDNLTRSLTMILPTAAADSSVL